MEKQKQKENRILEKIRRDNAIEDKIKKVCREIEKSALPTKIVLGAPVNELGSEYEDLEFRTDASP